MLEGAVLEGIVLEGALLEGAVLEGILLEGALLEGAVLEDNKVVSSSGTTISGKLLFLDATLLFLDATLLFLDVTLLFFLDGDGTLVVIKRFIVGNSFELGIALDVPDSFLNVAGTLSLPTTNTLG